MSTITFLLPLLVQFSRFRQAFPELLLELTQLITALGNKVNQIINALLSLFKLLLQGISSGLGVPSSHLNAFSSLLIRFHEFREVIYRTDLILRSACRKFMR